MRPIAVAGAMALASVVMRPLRGSTIPDLFNTGVGSNPSMNQPAVLLPGGAADPHWTFISGPVLPNTFPQARVEAANTVWIPDGPDSKWIGPAPSGSDPVPVGIYVYQTSFMAPPTGDLSSAFIDFRVSADDLLTDISLNGHTTGLTDSFGYGQWATLTVNRFNGTFVHGMNVLTFTIVNESEPTGLRFEQIDGFVPSPEPGLLSFAIPTALMLRRPRRAIA